MNTGCQAAMVQGVVQLGGILGADGADRSGRGEGWRSVGASAKGGRGGCGRAGAGWSVMGWREWNFRQVISWIAAMVSAEMAGQGARACSPS